MVQNVNIRDETDLYNKKLEMPEHKLSDDVVVYDASPFIVTKFLRQNKYNVQHAKYDYWNLDVHYFGRATFNLDIPESWNNVGLAGEFDYL